MDRVPKLTIGELIRLLAMYPWEAEVQFNDENGKLHFFRVKDRGAKMDGTTELAVIELESVE